jgi:hypothetical protein
MHTQPDLAAPVVLLVEAMRKNTAREIASLSGGEYEMFTTRHAFEARMTDFTNHLHSRYLLSFQPARPHPGLHQLSVRLKQPGTATVLARSSYWAVETQP